MSFSFSVRGSSLPTLGQLVDRVAEPELAFVDEPPADGTWPARHHLHPYVRRRSIRGVEIAHDEGALQVRIFTTSSRADYELGLRVVEAAAALTGGLVEPEDADPMPAADLRGQYGDAWMERMVPWGANILLHIVDKDQKTCAFDGVRRKVHVGPRLAARLRGESDARSVEQRLLDTALAIQNVDEDRWYPTRVLRVTAPDGSANYTVSAWAAEVAYLFPQVDRLALIGPDRQHVAVPASSGPEIAGSKWRYLDEVNALVEATPAREWPALYARAAAFATR